VKLPKRMIILTLSIGSSLMTIPAHAQLSPDAPVEQRLQIRTASQQIARQGDAVVTDADMGVYLDRLPEEHRSAFLYSRDRLGQAIENLMLPRLLFNEARRDDFLETASLQAKLFQSAVVLIGQEYMDHYFASQELEDYSQVAREMYLTDPDRFKSPATVDFTHVLVSVDVGRGELDGMKRIFSIYESLQDGASLDELAVEYSDDPSVVDNNGRYSEVQPETLDDAVAQALSLMQSGQVSEPVRSDFGWHVLRLDAKNEARQLDWEEARDEALQAARVRHMERARERLVQRLRADQLVVDPEAVQALLDRYEVNWQIAPEVTADD